MYMLYDETGVFVGMLSTHVGDCFCAGAGPLFESVVKTLRAEFRFGQWISARDVTLRYCGSDIK